MANTNLHVHVDTVPIAGGQQTRSRFGKPKDTDAIIFHNDDTQSSLQISITSDPANGPVLCKENNNKIPVPLPVSVPVGDKGKYTICQDFKGADFKYTAKIGTAVAEDPIIIIEKSKAIISVGLGGVLAAGAIGAVIGAVIANYLASRRMARLKPGP
ncbi:MAG TPA: hypothetical protein VKB41_06300 [Steroidobacteraceae bacterium]|nr:hypothetical protein [Steroidobacteraceae bacterium]